MKKIALLSVTALCLAFNAVAQDTTTSSATTTSDISVYGIHSITGKSTRPLVWYNHQAKKVFLDIRANFDWSGTIGVYVGKTYTHKNLWFTPEIGVLYGDKTGYNGFGPELLIGTTGKMKLFSFNQYVLSVDKNPTFFFNYTELGIVIFGSTKLLVGPAAQLYWETATGTQTLDIGPFAKLYIGSNFYFKPWITHDPMNNIDKVVVGLGYSY
jgi:hypothetical protein